MSLRAPAAAYPERRFMEIAYGECHCGCGHKTNIANTTNPELGYVKGEPMRYLLGHRHKLKTEEVPDEPNPSGICQCGCGGKTPLAQYTSRWAGYVKGKPMRFMAGHGGVKHMHLPPPNPSGFCLCQCGGRTQIADRSEPENGVIMGQHRMYIHNHHGKRRDYMVEDHGYKTPCWIWQKALDKNGYGTQTVKKRVTRAHRNYYQKAKGEIPEGFEVDHLCHITACINPDHLEAVTQLVNQRRKKRTILTIEKAREIREKFRHGMTCRELGMEYGVSRYTTRAVVNDLSWRE